MSRPPARPLAWLGASLLVSALGPTEALAAPFVGAGEAAIGESGDRVAPRRQALDRARRAALEAALAELEGGDPKGRARLLSGAAAWTSSYRILSQGDDGATAKVEVEVEIDLPRLEKLLGGATAPAGVSLPPVGRVTHQGCPEELVRGLPDLLVARGLAVASGDGPALDVALRCASLGLVPQARAHGAQVRVVAGVGGVGGGAGEESAGVAFAGDPEAAAHEALREALGGVGEALHAARDTAIALRLASPWPAARVRRLEKALGTSVVGVRSVAISGIEADGALILRIDGTLSADELAARMAALQVPGAPLRILGVDGPRRLSAAFGE